MRYYFFTKLGEHDEITHPLAVHCKIGEIISKIARNLGG